MQLTIDDRPNSLLELLWIREAFDLRPAGDDLPPLLVDTPAVVHVESVTDEVRAAFEAAWPRIWLAAATHAGTVPSPDLFQKLQATGDGSIDRAALLHSLIGPVWRDEFGDEVFDLAPYREWSERGASEHMAALPRSLDESPERRALSALVPAWRSGLTKVVTIPCAGEFTQRIGANALLITSSTRKTSAAYRHALDSFV